MTQIADLSEHGTDTKRVEKMRELLADHYQQRDSINRNYSDILSAVSENNYRYEIELQNQMDAQASLRRITINRFSTALSEDWEP